MEGLEDRSLMAAVAGGIDSENVRLASLASAIHQAPAAAVSRSAAGPAAALTDDPYEQNDSRTTARNLGTLRGTTTLSNLVMADANDWYRFTTGTKPGSGDSVSISFENTQGNLNLELYNVFGQRLRASSTTGNVEQISLNGLASGNYYIRVYGFLGATNPAYSLSVHLAGSVALPDDVYENNDTLATASNFGTLTSPKTVSNLVMADGHDWYRFTMTGVGASTDFVEIDFQNTQGNINLELYNSSGSRIAYSNSLFNGERLTLANRAAGTYYVHVFGANNPNYSLQVDPGTMTSSPPPPAGGSFNIQFRFSGLTSSEQAIFQQAATRWQSIVTGDLPSATYGGVAVDDLLIDARGAAIDGVGNILGEAGPDAFRSGSDLPFHGTMEFDSADMASMVANGTLLGVIEHEMGHVLGIGTIWSDKGLLVGAGTSNPRFIGPQATAAYNSIFGANATAGGVPVENSGGSGTRDAHWRESIFGSELMTGWVGPGSSMPISRITVGSLADLGYTVNLAAADSFSPPVSAALTSGSSSARTAGVSSGVGSHENAALVPLNERVLHSLAASWHADSPGGVLDGSLSATSRRSHEAATDALLAEWSSLSPSLLS